MSTRQSQIKYHDQRAYICKGAGLLDLEQFHAECAAYWRSLPE